VERSGAVLMPRHPSLPGRVLEVDSREQPQARGIVQQARDRETIAGLVPPDRGLRLGRIDAINGPRVKAKLL
jgi:hypothetical protein